MKAISILGVRIDDVSLDEAVDLVKSGLDDKKKYRIFTPNPEFLMAARGDPEFRTVLNNSDLNIPDGVGLKLSGQVKNTTSGVDLMVRLCQLASQNGLTVGFLGGKAGVAKRCAERLLNRYPGLKITIAEGGPKVNDQGEVLSGEPKPDTRYQIPDTDLLFVGFGQIKQEKWISNNMAKLPVKVIMGVGGAFDYLSGDVVRAPKWVRSLGLEWLFRLISQPWRIKRQLVLIKYIWLVLIPK